MTTYMMELEEMIKHWSNCRTGFSGIAVDSRHRLEIFLYSQQPDRIWGPPSLLFYGCQGVILWGKVAGTWSCLITGIYSRFYDGVMLYPQTCMTLWSGALSKAGDTVHYRTCNYLGSRKIKCGCRNYEVFVDLRTYIKQTYTFKKENNNPFEGMKKQRENAA